MIHHEPVNHRGGPAPGSTAAVMTAKGDEADLFERYADRLLRATARTVSAPAHVIDEACSFAWMQLVRTQPRRETVFAWLRVVAAREAVRVLRRDQRELSLEVLADASDADASDFEAFVEDTGPAVEDVATLHDALAAIEGLPGRRRRIFLLRLAGLSYKEITARTGEQPPAIARQVRKARERLRRHFDDGGKTSRPAA